MVADSRKQAQVIASVFLWRALPQHVDDHPFAIEFRQMEIIGSPLGYQFGRGSLVLNFINGDFFRRVFSQLAFLVPGFGKLNQLIECHYRSRAIRCIGGRTIKTQLCQLGMDAAFNAFRLDVVNAFDVIQNGQPHGFFVAGCLLGKLRNRDQTRQRQAGNHQQDVLCNCSARFIGLSRRADRPAVRRLVRAPTNSSAHFERVLIWL